MNSVLATLRLSLLASSHSGMKIFQFRVYYLLKLREISSAAKLSQIYTITNHCQDYLSLYYNNCELCLS